MRRIITMTTDFGTRDPFAGAMKGVILGLAPDVQIIDITHEIAPQDIIGGAFVLAGAVPYFPDTAIHIAVVDPGVGGDRKGIIVEKGETLFVGPDNGIFSLLLRREGSYHAVEIHNRKFVRETTSATFHGRDIFAPVAAHLARGIPIDAFGPALDRLVKLPIAEPQVDGKRLIGQVIHIDRFGNLITNISQERLDLFAGSHEVEVRIGERTLTGISPAYSTVPTGELMAVFGSMNVLEIAMNCGNASEMTGLQRGEHVIVAY